MRTKKEEVLYCGDKLIVDMPTNYKAITEGKIKLGDLFYVRGLKTFKDVEKHVIEEESVKYYCLVIRKRDPKKHFKSNHISKLKRLALGAKK